MNAEWIEGRFEGVYSGERRQRSGNVVFAELRKFSFELQSGKVVDIRSIAAPDDLEEDATEYCDIIRLNRISRVSLSTFAEQGSANEVGAASEALHETSLFDVRIREWRLAHPAEAAGRSFGTLYGTIQARLRPIVEEWPLELTSESASDRPQAMIEPDVAPRFDEGEESRAVEDECDLTAVPARVGNDPDVTLARFWSFVRIIAVLLIAGGLAYACGLRTAAIWSVPMLGALVARRFRSATAGVRGSLLHGLGIVLVALQISALYGPIGSGWQSDCWQGSSNQFLWLFWVLWLGVPVTVAGGLRVRWSFWVSASLWTVVMSLGCTQLDGSCSSAATVSASTADSVPQAGLERANASHPAGPRTSADGRWPADSSALSAESGPTMASTTAMRGDSGPGAMSIAGAAGPSAGYSGLGAAAGLTAGSGDSSRFGESLALDDGSIESTRSEAANHVAPSPGNGRSRRINRGDPTDSTRGGWVAPDQREAVRLAVMISLEHANRVPEDFYASGDRRRVYQPTDSIFEPGGSSLRRAGDLELMRIANLLNRAGKSRVRIEVHTDAGGSSENQLELSRRRGANIRDWLLDRGHLDAQRFEVVGIGSARPLVPMDGSYAAQQPNRRIEIRVVD